MVTVGVAAAAGFLGGMAASRLMGRTAKRAHRIVTTDRAPAAIGPYKCVARRATRPPA